MTEVEIINVIEKIANNVDLLVKDPNIVPMRLRQALIRIYEIGREDTRISIDRLQNKLTLRDLMNKIEETTENAQCVLIDGSSYTPKDDDDTDDMEYNRGYQYVYRAYKFLPIDNDVTMYSILYHSLVRVEKITDWGYHGIFWDDSRSKVVLIYVGTIDEELGLKLVWHDPNTGATGDYTQGIRGIFGKSKPIYFLSLSRLDRRDIFIPDDDAQIVNHIAR